MSADAVGKQPATGRGSPRTPHPGADKTTPLRAQYLRLKRQHPDSILLFRLGDFYEAFDDDARTVAADLEIVLTSREMGRGQRVPMAGVPAHSLDAYLARLVRRGHKVAICEQMGDASAPGLVDRQVVRVVTPGTVVEPSLLEEKANNYLAAAVVEGETAGFSFADVTTSEFAATQVHVSRLPLEIARISPAELLVVRGREGEVPLPEMPGPQPRVTPLDPGAFAPEEARLRLLEHFGAATLEAYGCDSLPLATGAAGGLLSYLQETQRSALPRMGGLHTYRTEGFMWLDPQARRNLELFRAGRLGSGTSLLDVLDLTRTPMGGRLLRAWLGQPLLDLVELEVRLDAVAWFHQGASRRQDASRLLARAGDLERLANRVGSGGALPREAAALSRSLQVVPPLLALLAEGGDAPAGLSHGLHPCQELVGLLQRALQDEPGQVGSGTVIRPGFSEEMDGLRKAAQDARAYIAGLEQRERERTGIASLKVGYNRVFGYYLEVSRPNLPRVPADYVRRQTLVNGERFITPDLKEQEALVLGAQERLEEMEAALFRQVCARVGSETGRILETAGAMARLDVFTALAEAAHRYGYVRPTLSAGDALEIRGGRHPVVERVLPGGTFVPNDTSLGGDGPTLAIITGPNMAGKSTYIRQVALICLMAQAGSFVPADSATIGLVDRIFTRVGLQDDLVTGHSTFMVEMVETASILHHATPRSLVVLDEIGRGTSTYDGLAIARAVAEHIHSHPGLGCKTLFATHYHELTDLPSHLPRAQNLSVAVLEEGDGVVFLHRIVPGPSHRSYGVHVARLAGLPAPVLSRAWEVLWELEGQPPPQGGAPAPSGRRGAAAGPHRQLPLWEPASAQVAREIEALDVATMTPLEALNRLYRMQQQLRGAPEPGGRD